MMETVGVYLKRERESKNLSLGEVSRLTKISELYLDYIEKDEFEKLPQGPYAKGYIASYSRLIGGNVDEAISLYEALTIKSRFKPRTFNPTP
jgi:cytoskeleton protein RodZ